MATALMLGAAMFHQSATEQLEERMNAFVAAVEDGDRGDLAKLIADSYSDRWGLNKEELLLLFRDFRAQFITINVELNQATHLVTGRKGSVSCFVRVRGTGPGAALEGSVNGQTEPFHFSWTKEDWRPWGWKLTRVDHPEIHLPDGYKPGEATGQGTP